MIVASENAMVPTSSRPWRGSVIQQRVGLAGATVAVPLLAFLPLFGGVALAQSIGEPPPPRPAMTPAETEVAPVGSPAGLALATPPGMPAPGQPLSLTYPLDRPATEIDPYGWRYSPSRQAWRMHTGVDLVVAAGTAVRSVLPGTVRLVEEISGYGLTVVIEHGRGWQSLYAHLLEASVGAGEPVGAGQPLGRVGQSGNATAPHLHIELRRLSNGRLVALDPGPLLQPPWGSMTKPLISSDPPP
jgi:murein DD-endopeptidase MepM/ murein hydrolase activator NlpD